MEFGADLSNKINPSMSMGNNKWGYSRFLGIVCILVLFACQPKSYSVFLQNEEIALANPVIIIDSILFSNRASVSVLPVQPKAVIRYTTDGAAVTATSPICPNPLVLNHDTDVKCKAFHSDFKPSETFLFSVRKTTAIKPKIVATSTPPKAPYEGKGLAALSNFQKGEIDFRANQEWLGYQNEVIELHLDFGASIYCKQITLSTLCDYSSWIFNPSKIELIQNGEIIASLKLDKAEANEATTFCFFDLPVAASMTRAKLKIYMDKIPDWHGGKGTIPWFFIDEIIVQ